MQEINLLQNKLKDRSDSWSRKNTVITTAFAGVTVLVLAFGGYLYYANGKIRSDIDNMKVENVTLSSKLESGQGQLAEAQDFQAQLKNADALVSNHVYWSRVFDQVQQSILKQSQYLLLQAKTDGKIHVEGITDSYTSLGKLLLSLNTDQNIRNVKLMSVQSSTGAQFGYTYAINFEFNTDLLEK